MKIRLLKDLRVHPRHGLVEGREFNCEIRRSKSSDGKVTHRHWIISDNGDEFAVWPHEFEEIKDDD